MPIQDTQEKKATKTFLTKRSLARWSTEALTRHPKLRCFTELPVSEGERELQLHEFRDLLTRQTSIRFGQTLTYITLPTDGSIVSFVD